MATALNRPPAWEPLYAVGMALKRKRQKKKSFLPGKKLANLSFPIFGHFTIDEIPASGTPNLEHHSCFCPQGKWQVEAII